MKHFLYVCLLVVLSTTQLCAYTTTISSYVYPDQTGIPGTYQSSGTIPTHIKRVTINNLTDIPDFQTAMDAASYIFSDAMSKMGIDLVNILAEVTLENFNINSDAICRVDIVYTDTIDDISDYHQFSPYCYEYNNNYIYPYPVLVPKAMSDQTRRENHGVGMQIRLNSSIPFHGDVTNCPEDKYDLITILLRALAMGCGIQSTFDASSLSLGIENGEDIYINAFDTQIFNENNVPLYRVIAGDLSLSSFLIGKHIYAEGCPNNSGSDTVIIELFNMWKYYFPS